MRRNRIFNVFMMTTFILGVSPILVLGGRVALAQDFTQRTVRLDDGKDYLFSAFTTPEGKPYGYVVLQSAWPKESDGSAIVFVCWENYDARFKNEHQLVHDAVTETWQQNSKIEFRGWHPCAKESSGIRIYVLDSKTDGPHTKGYGRELDGLEYGMVLNFTFNSWSESCNVSPEEREYCIKAIAVHEFGHAIGFAHEQNRPDRRGDCRELPQGSSEGAVMLTPYDPHSVMNYCNRRWNNDGTLSALDIETLQKLYGAK